MGTTVVVGGGIVGLSVAWRLAQAGLAVTLLEANAPGSGATYSSFGWLTSSSSDLPSKNYPGSYHRLRVDGIDEYHRVARELGSDRWLHFDGHVEWDASEGGSERIRAKVDDLQGLGYGAELLPARELRYLEPDLVAPDGLEAFIYYPHEGYIDPGALVGLLAARARDLGAEIRTGVAVSTLVREQDRVTGVVLENGDHIDADMVVNCAGNWTPELLEQVGQELPMAPTVGMVAVTGPSPVQLRSVHHNEAMSIRPDGAGRIMMRHWDFDKMVNRDTPTDEHPGFLDDLLERVVHVLPGLAGSRVESMRIAVRPITRDNLPIVGPIANVNGLYVIVGHAAITHGALLGRLAAREIAHDELDARLEDFRPSRLITPLSTVV